MRYSDASSGVRMSGSDTISISGVPARFRSTRLAPLSAVMKVLSGVLFEMDAREPMRLTVPSTTISTYPCSQIGSSYCDIW